MQLTSKIMAIKGAKINISGNIASCGAKTEGRQAADGDLST